MGKRLEINPGDRFGRLIIDHEIEKRNGRRYFLCQCECGNKKEVRLESLVTGNTTSCGCYNREVSGKVNTKHGQYESRIYRIWQAMKRRCCNPNSDSYKNYGGRGIRVCKKWMNFESFRDWALKNEYDEHLTIERKNVNGNYEPSNCTWITLDAQKRNTTVTKRIKFDGKEMTLRQWAEHIGIHSSTLSNRFKNGWPIDKALTTPSQKKFVRKDQRREKHDGV